MTALERLLIEQACARVINRYAALMDAAEFEGVAALFTQGAAYARPADPANPIHGRAAILADFRSRPARLSRHIVSNVVVQVEADDRATAHSRVTLYVGAGNDIPAAIERTLVGDFHDILEKVGDDWLFAERRGSVTLRG